MTTRRRSGPSPLRAATVAPTFVPLLSSKNSTSFTVPTGSTRCGSPRYSRRPYSMAESGQPAACASASAARALVALWRPRIRKASAGIRRWMCSSSSAFLLRRRVSSASCARTSQAMPLTTSIPKSPGRCGMSAPKVTWARCCGFCSLCFTGGGMDGAPTLATACAALPPKGAAAAFGRPGGGSMCITSASSRLSTIRACSPKMRALAAA